MCLISLQILISHAVVAKEGDKRTHSRAKRKWKRNTLPSQSEGINENVTVKKTENRSLLHFRSGRLGEFKSLFFFAASTPVIGLSWFLFPDEGAHNQHFHPPAPTRICIEQQQRERNKKSWLMQIGMKFGTPGVYSIWRNRFAFIRSAEEHETSKAVHHNENYISRWDEILFKYLQYNYDRNSSFFI